MEYLGKLTDTEAQNLVKEKVDLTGGASHRLPFVLQWRKNWLYFIGRQHFVETSQGSVRDPQNIPRHRVFYRANKILGYVMRATDTVSSASGRFDVPPLNGTAQARHAAWVSGKLFEHLSQACDWDRKRLLGTLNSAIFGSGFYKITWDPKKGDPIRFYFDEAGKALGDPSPEQRGEMERQGHFEDFNQGEVRIDVPLPFQVHWDWRARELGFEDEACLWAAQTQLVAIDTVKEMYGAKASNVTASRDTSGSLYYQENLSFLSGGNYAGSSAGSSASDQYVLLVEYFERPTKQNKMMGRRIVMAGDQIMEQGDNPYRVTNHPLPFVKQDWWPCPGRFMGLSLVEQLISSQFQRNKSVATLIEFQNVFGHPPVAVDKNRVASGTVLSMEPGTIIEKTGPGAIFEVGPQPTLPAEVVQVGQITDNDMATISSQTGAEDSKLPGQIRGAPGLEIMEEKANKLLAPTAKLALISQVEVGRSLLGLAKSFYGEDRTIHYIGEDKRFRAVSFHASDISVDLRVIIDPGRLITSPTVEKAKVVEYIQAGAVDPINNPDDREAVFKALAFGSAEELIADRLMEEENQEREIAEMVADPLKYLKSKPNMMAPEGAPPEMGYPIDPDVDDHRAHLKVTTRYIRSPEYRALDPITQSVIRMHHRAHQMIYQMAMAQQMQAIQAQKGAPGDKGRASQPKNQEQAA